MALYSAVDDGYDVTIFSSVNAAFKYAVSCGQGDEVYIDDNTTELLTLANFREALRKNGTVWIYTEE
jgi:hypothetical protein